MVRRPARVAASGVSPEVLPLVFPPRIAKTPHPFPIPCQPGLFSRDPGQICVVAFLVIMGGAGGQGGGGPCRSGCQAG